MQYIGGMDCEHCGVGRTHASLIACLPYGVLKLPEQLRLQAGAWSANPSAPILQIKQCARHSGAHSGS